MYRNFNNNNIHKVRYKYEQKIFAFFSPPPSRLHEGYNYGDSTICAAAYRVFFWEKTANKKTHASCFPNLLDKFMQSTPKIDNG